MACFIEDRILIFYFLFDFYTLDFQSVRNWGFKYPAIAIHTYRNRCNVAGIDHHFCRWYSKGFLQHENCWLGKYAGIKCDDIRLAVSLSQPDGCAQGAVSSSSPTGLLVVIIDCINDPWITVTALIPL